MARKFKLVALHGETSREAVHKRHAEDEIRRNVAEKDRTAGPVNCEVLAVFVGLDGDERLELVVSDWAEAAALAKASGVEVSIKPTA